MPKLPKIMTKSDWREVGGGGEMQNIHAVCLKVKGFCLFRSIRTEFLIYL